ncbi:interferon-inducible GTPase 1-like [Liolophura sinensis]|uniref:interferon-inducible GTPase 1-like n=1 Tax=Liolophura sinensis TaxID=3198878 RepID=UPI00315916C1
MAERKKITLNVAVIGKSGSGKSTFINSYCRIPRGSENAAETDVIECTSELMFYERKTETRRISEAEQLVRDLYDADYEVVLWDCPGFGTSSFPDDEYIKKINLEYFDFYLLFSCTRFFEYEIAINNFIAQQNKTYFYVRAKIDRDIINDKRSHPRTSSAEKVKQCIRNKVKENMSSDSNVFLVNAKDCDAFDFPELEDMLVFHAASSKYNGDKHKKKSRSKKK